MARYQKNQIELLDTSSSSKHSWQAVVGFTGEQKQCRFQDQNRQTKVLSDGNVGLGVRNNSDRGLAKLPCLKPTVILYKVSPLLGTNKQCKSFQVTYFKFLFKCAAMVY